MWTCTLNVVQTANEPKQNQDIPTTDENGRCTMEWITQGNHCYSHVFEVDTGYQSYCNHEYKMNILMKSSGMNARTGHSHQHKDSKPVGPCNQGHMDVTFACTQRPRRSRSNFADHPVRRLSQTMHGRETPDTSEQEITHPASPNCPRKIIYGAIRQPRPSDPR